jgi:hypothetical protein
MVMNHDRIFVEDLYYLCDIHPSVLCLFYEVPIYLLRLTMLIFSP